ncbi:hypothetical protein LTR53_001853 [Teratosphaeriaceae sp. CCFEE 6253]|nr:hypothetical protein LTR53_001853 [Teratosphaeriaceae sp. CCFEE 6253]
MDQSGIRLESGLRNGAAGEAFSQTYFDRCFPERTPSRYHQDQSHGFHDHFGRGGLGVRSFGSDHAGLFDQAPPVQTGDDMLGPLMLDDQDWDGMAAPNVAPPNPSNGQPVPIPMAPLGMPNGQPMSALIAPLSLLNGQPVHGSTAPPALFNGPLIPIPVPQQQQAQPQIPRMMTRQTALSNPRNRIAAWNAGFRVGEAPQEDTRMTPEIGAIEMLTLLPNHTKRPMALHRLLSNGWKARQIAAVLQFARGAWMPTPGDDPIQRRDNVIRQQKRWTKLLGAATPVTNYSTVGYAQRTANATEEDVTLASIALNVVNWPSPLDCVTHHFVYPIDPATHVPADRNPLWD